MSNAKSAAGEKKLNAFGLSMILCASTCTINCITMGGAIGTQTTFRTGMIAMVIGLVIMWAIATLSGLACYKKGVITAVLWQSVYGKTGARIPSIAVGTCLVFWAVFDYWYCGAAMKALIPGAPDLGFTLGIIFVILFAFVGCVKGFASLQIVSDLSLPVAIILFIVVLRVVFKEAGGLEAVLAAQPEVPLPFASLINFYLASFMTVLGLFGDLCYPSNSGKTVVIGVTASMIMIFFLAFVGHVSAVGLGVFGAIELAARLGGPLLVVTNLFTLIATGNSAPGNLILSSNQYHEITKKPKMIFLVLFPIISGALAFVIEYGAGLTVIQSWINVVGIMFAPVVTITLVEFWINNKGDVRSDMPAWNVPAIISMFLGMGVGIYFTYFNFTIPATVASVIGTMIIYFILSRAMKKA